MGLCSVCCGAFLLLFLDFDLRVGVFFLLFLSYYALLLMLLALRCHWSPAGELEKMALRSVVDWLKFGALGQWLVVWRA